MSDKQLQSIRGEHISMIFQQPGSALNPVQRSGSQITEVYKLHRNMEEGRTQREGDRESSPGGHP